MHLIVLLVRDFEKSVQDFYFQWDWVTCSLVGVDVGIFCFLFVFLFALHGGNEPHNSCETLRRDIQPQNGATGLLLNDQIHERFCQTHSIVKQTKTQTNTVTVYSSPPQISIINRFFVIVSLYGFFLTYFIFVHNFCCLFFCFQRRE